MPRLYLILLFSMTSTFLTAQATFKKRFGTSVTDRAFSVEVLPDNSFIVCGGSTGGGLGFEDAMLIKISATGTVEWSKSYGGQGNDGFRRIFACSDGNYIALGETNGMGAGGWDIYVVKFDINGNILWERTCGGASLEGPRGICEVSDGYIITGNTQSFGNGNSDIFGEKLDFSGNSVWCKSWGTSGPDRGGDPFALANGEILITGSWNAGSNNDGILLRINAGGTVVSATRYGGSDTEDPYYLSPGGPGFVVSGSSTDGSLRKPMMAGFNASGGLVWAKQFTMPGGNYEINAEECPDGGFIFAPHNIPPGATDAYLVKTDGNGNIVWAKAHSFDGNGRTFQARPTPDGGYVAVGHCSNGADDFFILKTDANGNVDGCCPVDAPITVEVISPPSSNPSPGNTNGPAAGTPAGQEQDVDLEEENMCDSPSCCPTDAGTMLVQTLHACINEPATLTHNGDEVLDNDDLLQFILFSDLSDTLGSIIAISNTPTFTFNPATMQTGVTYYVAAIAGNNVGGNVDFDDPCFDISNAVELVWHPLPEVELQTDNSDVCPGDCRTLSATLTGTPPFTLTVTTPAGTTTVTLQNNTGTFEICPPPGTPPGSFTVQAAALTDAYCSCP